MSVSDSVRHQSKTVVVEQYLTTAYNYRMTDIQAAIGIEQLKKLPDIINSRRTRAQYYLKKLNLIEDMCAATELEYCRTNWQSFPLRLAEEIALTRDDLIQHFQDAGISTRPGIMNIHQEQPYKNDFWKLPHSEQARARTILLPLFASMTKDQLEQVVKICEQNFHKEYV